MAPISCRFSKCITECIDDVFPFFLWLHEIPSHEHFDQHLFINMDTSKLINIAWPLDPLLKDSPPI